VLLAPGKVAVVIDVQGARTSRLHLTNPARLRSIFTGARLLGPATLYDGRNRGGIRNIRYAQFRPDVVRIVIDLDVLKDYQIKRGDTQVRIELGTDRATFDAWSSQAVASVPLPSPPPVEPEVGVMVMAEPSSPPMSGFQSAPVHTDNYSADPLVINRYLAAHAAEGAQSPAPRITVRWDGADIEDVVAGFAAFSGRTIMVGKDAKGKVTAEIKNQPWDLAFAAVLESQGLTYQVLDGGIINVLNKADFARADSTVPVETRLVRINYAKAARSAGGAIDRLGGARQGGGRHEPQRPRHHGHAQPHRRRRAVRPRLDIRTPQVSIQAKIIFVDRTDIENIGVKYDLGSQTQFFNSLVQRPIQSTAAPGAPNGNGVPTGTLPTQFYSSDQTVVDLGGNSLSATGNAAQAVVNPALNLIFSTAIGNFDLTAFLQALQSLSLDDIQAEPTITTLDNRPAQILVGDRVPIRVIDASAGAGVANAPTATVSFEQTGINLRVTPHVTANRQILMEVHAERSNVVPASVDIGFTFQTQQADNQILVSDGETAVIGGLTVTEVTVSKTGIPFLVDLPIVGKLFGFTNQQETRRDLLILITPHIIDDLVTPSAGK
jgi:type IV pilus assembly protein PilQ